MREELSHVESAIRQILRPYGLYLGMRGAKRGEQRYALAFIGLVALSCILWALKTYLKSYLEEKGKLRARKGTESVHLPDRTAAPEDLRKEIKSLINEIRSLKVDNRRRYVPNSNGIADFLMNYGLPREQASNVAPKVARIIIEFIETPPFSSGQEEDNDNS